MTIHSVFVIDDDEAVRDSLLTLLRVHGIRTRGFASGQEFFANLPEEASACVVTDVRMPDMDGTEVVRRLAETKGHAWPIIVITGHADVPMVIQMMKSGVVDFIEKPFDPSRLIEAVQGCIGHLSERMEAQQARQMTQARLEQLTPREAQVFQGLIEGKSNKEIALNLDISPRTVEIFRAKVMDKMQASTLSALVRMGMTLAA